MRMQEPEQWPSSGQEWQAGQEYNEYQAGYAGEYEAEQQQQKMYPQEPRRQYETALGILAIILSALGFFLTVAGIVGAALVLEYANGQQALLAGGVLGLVSSILVMLVCLAIFVIAVVVLARRAGRVRLRNRMRAPKMR